MKTALLVFTSSFPSRDGATEGIFVQELAAGLSPDFRISVLTPKLRPEAASFEEYKGLRIHRFSDGILCGHGGMLSRLRKHRWLALFLPWFLLVQFLCLVRILRREKIEVVHAHWFLPQALLAVLAKKLFFPRLRVVATSHGSDLLGKHGGVSRRLLRFTLAGVDDLSVVGPELAQVAESLGRKTDHIYPMGIDTELFSPAARADRAEIFGGTEGPFLLFVGRMVPSKRGDVLIRATALLRESRPGVRLLMIGDGPQKEDWRALAETLGVAECISFLPAQPHEELPRCFASCDCFVMPSESEGFGLVTLEALACGTPCAASDLPVYRKLDREAGFELVTLFPTGAAEILAEKLAVLPTRGDERAAARRRRFVVERFGMERCLENYRELLSGIPRPAADGGAAGPR